MNYPPQEIISSPLMEKKSYEHILLWMLFNNKECEWSDFLQKPLEIPSSTLSRHLKLLNNQGYLTKISKGHYKITVEGKKRFFDLSKGKETKRKLSFPPNIILKDRNYDHWILWMVYNNNYCRWSDFLKEPVYINQSSLSKVMNLLINNGFIRKDLETKEYSITQLGKLEYSKMLKHYDLDRQTILNEESKRIEAITKKMVKFFQTYDIDDASTQFRLINNILKLDYNRVKSVLKNEEDFHKILYFLSLNHPFQYPSYIYPEEFSKKYGIKENMLTYYIDEIVQNNIYSIKFFDLKIPLDKHYYFQENEKLERMIRAITEDYIKENTYLNKLFAESLKINVIIDEISEEICNFLLNRDLMKPLKEFLPEYINHLAYKVEARRDLIKSYDKLEGLIWQGISTAINIDNINGKNKKYMEEINKKIESHPQDIDLYYSKVQLMMSYGQFDQAYKFIDKMITIFPENEKDIKIKKASLLKKNNEVEAGFQIINTLLKKYPIDIELLVYKAYWLQFLNRKQESIKVISNLIKLHPNNGTYYDTYGEILMYFEEYQSAVDQFEKSIELTSDQWYINQTYIKLGICYKELGNNKLARKYLSLGKDLTKSSSGETNVKQKWLKIVDIFLEQMQNSK